MKALLICPDTRNTVSALGESTPLANAPILGKPLIVHWLEHLMVQGALEVHILASDRPQLLRSVVGNGSRWGLRVEVHPETSELSPDEAREKYEIKDDGTWLPAPHDATCVTHLPGLPQFPLFASYAIWFAAAQALLPFAATPDRIGVREIKPGVWVGLHTKISKTAVLNGPCWIGEEVYVGPGCVIGPAAVLEDKVCVERNSEITHSIIGPETFVGQCTEIRCSLAWGSTLINWRLDSCVKVADAFLLCSMEHRPFTLIPTGLVGRISALVASLLPPRPRGHFGGLLQPAISESRQP